jgi:TolB-like protein/Tfp pilus assembly protein PilF
MAQFFEELKRRNVLRVALVYLAASWLLIQVVETLFPIFGLSVELIRLFAILLIIGFPIILILTWFFELTPEGVMSTEAAEAAGYDRPAAFGRHIDFVIIALLVIAVVWLVYERESGQAASDNSVAVLPFENLSLDPDDAFFAAGIHEETLNQLAKLRNLSVTSRTSVLRFQDTDLSIPEIAEELNVRTIMEGSVRYAADRVRVTAQLIDADTDEHLWSEVYERDFADIFSIQSDIAVNIANALEAEFSLEERQSIERAPTDSPEAYALYLKGRYFWNIRTEEAIQKALDYFQQAVALDSGYALAYSGIGDVWIFRGWYSVLAPKETFPKAIEAVTKALSFDETLAEAHTSRAHVYLEFEHDWAAAEAEYLRAIELNPRYPIAHHWYGGFLSAMERHDEALRQAHAARELNPLSLIINTWVGLRHYFAGRYIQAIHEYEKALELNPDFAPAHWHLGWALEQTGQYDAAVASAERAMAISDNPIYLSSLGHAHAKSGNEGRARNILDRLAEISLMRHVSAYHTAVIHAALGDIDESFTWLERAFAERSPWIGYMKVDPRLDPLRSDTRFNGLLRQARLD